MEPKGEAWVTGPSPALQSSVCSNKIDGLMLKKKMNVFAFYSMETENWGTQWKEIVCIKASEEVKTVKYFWDLERSLVWKIRASSSLKGLVTPYVTSATQKRRGQVLLRTLILGCTWKALSSRVGKWSGWVPLAHTHSPEGGNYTDS